MNYRDYKQFGQGEYYHIYNRGNARADTFLDDQDYNFFLLRLKQNLLPELNSKLRIQLLPANSFSLICYCLMPNHFHLLIRQNREITPAKLLLKVCTSYSKYFNKKYGKVGHVFQDRYKQANIYDNEYLLWLSFYIHQNPKVSNLVRSLEDYEWSSYKSFIDLKYSSFCEKDVILSQFKSVEDYRHSLESSYELIKSKKGLENLTLD